MPERGRGRASIGRILVAWLLVLAAAVVPLTVAAREPLAPDGAHAHLAAPPDETCAPGATFGAGGFEVCSPPTVQNPGGGGFNLGGLLPILGGVVIGAGLALVVAYLVLRRRAGAPLDPVDAGEWWTCRKCGSNNVVGSPRCYSCGTWQGG